MRRFPRPFRSVLEGIARHSARRISQLPLAHVRRRGASAVDWNATQPITRARAAVHENGRHRRAKITDAIAWCS